MQSLLYCQGPVTITAENSFMKYLLYCQGPVKIAADNSFMKSHFIPFTHKLPIVFVSRKNDICYVHIQIASIQILSWMQTL